MAGSDTYRKRRARSECVTCGRLDTKQTKCDDCKIKHKAWKTKRLEAGLCGSCGKPREPSRDHLCQACLQRVRDRHDKLKADGRCTGCSGENNTGRLKCEACTEKDNKRRDELVANKCCISCYQPHSGRKRRCTQCLDRLHKWSQARYDKGNCIRCNSPRDSEKMYCSGCRKACSIQGRKKNQELRDEAFAKYGGYRCVCCGETQREFIELDHVNNDGASHRRLMKEQGYGLEILRWLKDNNYPPIVQPLCANCNRGKQRNGGVCPHEAEREEFANAFASNFQEMVDTITQPH